MFQSSELENHLKTSDTIQTESLIHVEWNLNDPQNISLLGNYRYRPGTVDNKFSTIPQTFDPNDDGNYYTGATDSDISLVSGIDEDDNPTLFTTPKEKMKLLYSLEDCVKMERPRSGINKLLYLDNPNQYIDIGDTDPENQETLNIARRPRYYMASRNDQFKYWTSYRTASEQNIEQNISDEYGISRQPDANGLSYIYDTAPFVVYKENIPANRVVVKMQTNVGDINLGPFRQDETSFNDPLFGFNNQTTPQRWAIQVLKGNEWVEAIAFDENSLDDNNNPIIKSDGYVEISYGLKVPDFYKDKMILIGELSDTSLLPDSSPFGYTFLIKQDENDVGVLYFYDGASWVAITPEYGWFLHNQNISNNTRLLTELSNPDYFIDSASDKRYREFDLIRGIRIVVKTMNKSDCTFDLIEMSPRLVADITDKVSSFSITKRLSDLGNSSIPVGDIFASTGSITIFDDDFSFNQNNIFNESTNRGSVVAKYTDMRAKFTFYNITKEVQGFDYYIPIKTMYSDEIPSVSGETSSIDFTLRDKFYFFESSPAPELLMTDVSISYAVTLLLDYIGFSNCVFKRIDGIPEIIIPFFFVSPNQNVVEVLRQLAIASQSAMFFDEYNNFVVMSKEYLLPELSQRPTDSYLYGQDENTNLPNIINLSSQEKKVYNQGKIDYTARYLQRSITQQEQSGYIDKYKTYGYKPSLLWEVSGRERLRSQNENIGQGQGFALTAMPLNTDLTEDIPIVSNQRIINNVIDFSDGIEWIASYNGYFYANGEVIKYDAVEYAYTGPLNGEENVVWIKNNEEYQRYFSRLPFNGKMYPTGNVRIFVEPEYEFIDGQTRLKEGAVKKHGRGQFGTPITFHPAGLNSYWSDNNNVKGCLQQSKDYLFNTSEIINYPDNLTNSSAGKINETIEGIPRFDSDQEAKNSSRGGIIKNFRVNKYYTENENDYFDTSRAGTLQSSALVFQGPELPSVINKGDFVSYVYKNLDNRWVIAPAGTLLNTGFWGDVPGEPGWRWGNQAKTIKISPDGTIYIKNGKLRHFGTRMRIIGKILANGESAQTAFGAFPIFETQDLNIDDPEKNIQILGGSGGLAFGLNENTNVGYYFEIVSLTADNINKYNGAIKENQVGYSILSNPAASCVDNVVTVSLAQNVLDPPEGIQAPIINTGSGNVEQDVSLQVGEIINVSGLVDSLNPTDTDTPLNGDYEIIEILETGKKLRYRIPGDPIPDRTSTTGGLITKSTIGQNVVSNIYFYKILADKDGNAVPYKLWSGVADILVDDGKFTGQYRFTGEENPTVYDLSAEYINRGNRRIFYLSINNKEIAIVEDDDPLPEYNNMALFVRGSSKCMFENIYAIGANLSQNGRVVVTEPVSKIWNVDKIDATDALKKYALSGVIQKTYLSGISGEEPPTHIIYFDEFGTIMREAAYFNIKYDRSYPALYSRVMKTFSKLQGYTISGYYGSSYGADFLVFNCTDKALKLDETTGNFLRIQGITFTQNTTRTLSVDDYYKKVSSFSDPIVRYDSTLVNPLVELEEYNKIVNSRNKYGVNDFSLESPYIQTEEAAENILGWTIKKISSPKVVAGINTFATQNLQLGDIVQVNYKNNEGVDVISDENKRFVIYNIDYTKSVDDETMTMYLAEV